MTGEGEGGGGGGGGSGGGGSGGNGGGGGTKHGQIGMIALLHQRQMLCMIRWVEGK